MLIVVIVGAALIAISCIGAILALGRQAVLRLRLPTDLPLELRFTPPAPTITTHKNPESAQAAAAIQQRWSVAYQEARRWAEVAFDHEHGPQLLPDDFNPDANPSWKDLISEREAIIQEAKRIEESLKNTALEEIEQAIQDRNKKLTT